MQEWKYGDKKIETLEDTPEGSEGFVYEILHKPTGRKYIGKKVLYNRLNKKLGKRELGKLKEERKEKGIGGRLPKKKKVIKESDWKKYYGSTDEIKVLIKEGKQSEFERNIIRFVKSRKLLTYYETKILFEKEVIESDNNYINDNIAGKFFRRDFIQEKEK